MQQSQPNRRLDSNRSKDTCAHNSFSFQKGYKPTARPHRFALWFFIVLGWIFPLGVSGFDTSVENQSWSIAASPSFEAPHQSQDVRNQKQFLSWNHEGIRWGEAKNPGPEEGSFDTKPFTLGYGNPTGLIGKEHLIQQLPRGVWGFAETHLTQRGLQKFRTALRCQQGTHAPRIIPGAYARYLSNNIGTIGGKAEGVCFLTHVPGRALHHDWPIESWHTARIQAAAFQVGLKWIQGGICYGYAKNACTKEVQDRTDALLKHLTDRIVLQSQGPRFIMGDFNQQWDTLDQISIWREHGFVEAQHFASYTWNQPIQKTCKGKTVKDFIWLSREILPFVTSVSVDSSWFADHAVIQVTFSDFGTQMKFPLWRKPSPINWDKIAIEDRHVPVDHEHHTEQQNLEPNADAKFVNICHRFEKAADAAMREKTGGGLLPRQKGRGQTREVTWIQDKFVPIKRARPGDFATTFVGDHMQHAQWTRQLRRLHSLVQFVKSPKYDASAKISAAAMWRAIIAAKGFEGGFRKHWTQRSVVHPDAPATIPKLIPEVDTIEKIYLNYKAEFDELEKTLLSERLQKSKFDRSNDPNKIYQDVARPQALPVQTLVDTHETTVTRIDEDGITLHYDPINLDPQLAIHGPEGYLVSSNHQPGSFQLPPDHGLQVGDKIQQRIIVGQLSEVFDRFKKLWEQRWDRHRNVEASTWTPFLNFLHQHVPSPDKEMELPRITVSDWYAAVRAKKNRTAGGPDGFNKQDLIHMPPVLVQELLDLLHTVEQGKPWPLGLTTGLISAIEKIPDAESPSQFRPITVLSLIYRTWSSIRARQLLDWLNSFSPDGLSGNRKGHSTAQVWWSISAQLETTWYENSELSGAIGDIIKCFNNLPRVPVLAIAKHLKVADHLIVPWFHSISQLQRRFVVAGGTGPICLGVTGFPEGDPLSVCSMYLVNIVMDQWIKCQLQQSQLLTFVDNIEIVSRDYLETAQAMIVLERFCKLLDIELDKAKTVFWAATPEARKHFRDQHFEVSMGGRDLGGHVSYCKRHTNSTITTRCTMTATLWDLLKRSNAPIHHKSRVCHTVAWPRALHGCSNVSIAPAHIKKLRTGAMKALGFARKGASPIVQLSLCLPPKCDPGFWMLRETLMQFRRCCKPDSALPLLDHLSVGYYPTTFPGPCGVLLSRLHEVGWSWIGNGWISDHNGLQHHLLHSPIQQLCGRLETAWCQYVGGLQTQRKTMQGMQDVDVEFSTHQIDKLTGEEQGILRVAMNGTFYTNDKLIHGSTVQTTICPWCPSEDSIEHRHLHCPYMQDLWSQIPNQRREAIQDLCKCTINHLWFPELQAMTHFRRALNTIQDTTGVFEQISFQTDMYHLFTDGSCLKPEISRLRLATWAVVGANLSTQQFEPISSGGVPGLLQTIGRAEYLAALAALRFLLASGKGGFLWIDNLTVQQTVKDFLQGGGPPDNMEADHDLKQRLHEVCQRILELNIPVKAVKVRSHEDETAYSDFVERWAIEGNNCADRQAGEARRSLPTAVLQIWPGLVKQHERQQQFRADLRWLFLKVGKRSLETMEERVEKEGEEPYVRPQPDIPADFPEGFYPFPSWDNRNPDVDLGEAGAVVYEWLQDLTQDSDAEPMWISTYQLLVDFQLTTARIGPRRKCQRWDLGDHEDFDFFQSAKDLGAFLRKLSSAFELPLQTQCRRPDGTSFATWCRPFLIRAAANRVDRADQLLLEWATRPVKYLHRDLKGCGPWIRSRG